MGLAHKALETLSFRAVALPLSFATAVITSRLLLPEGRGAFVIGLLSVGVASTLLGNGTAVSHEIGRRGEADQAIVCRALLLSIVLGTVGAVILAPTSVFLIEGYPAAQLFALGLPAILIVQTLGGGLLAKGRLRLYNGVDVVTTTLWLVGMLILVVWLDQGFAGAVVAWLIAQVVAATVLLIGARSLWLPLPQKGSWRSLGHLGSTFRLGFKAGLVTLVGLVNYRIELFILEAYRGLDAVGVYSIAMSLADLLLVLPATLTAVVVEPAIRKDEAEAVRVVSQAVRHAILLTAIFGAMLAVASTVFVPLLFGEDFAGAVTPLFILIAGRVVYSLAGPVSIFFSVRLGRMRYPLIVAGISAVITAGLCFVLVPNMGSNGAAISTTAGNAVGALIFLVQYLRATRVSVGQLVPGVGDLMAYRDLARTLRSRLA